MILPVILSGGVGSRLWPLSRKSHPKPFIKLSDGESFIQKTYKRAISISSCNEIITVTNRDLFFYSKDEFEEINNNSSKNTFLLEPMGKNSTAAIAIASCHAIDKYGPDSVILVMPSDHLIGDMDSFFNAVQQAKELAQKGKLVTFGIKPLSPETGYGYIQADGFSVKKFVEKPNKKIAEEYFNSGDYFWNSGMFCMRADKFLSELSLFHPEIADKASRSVSSAKQSSGVNWNQIEIQRKDFESIESISVDYAVFEKSKSVSIVPCDIKWSDIGSWNEFGSLHPEHDNENNIYGNAICKKTSGCVIHSGNKLVATIGVKDLIISDTSDALLVAHKDNVQDVRGIVDDLKDLDHKVYKEFPTMHRPWGTYTVLQEGISFKLKRIEVKSGQRLSLQSHKYRSEHWVVVSGVALVLNGDKEMELTSNQSTYVPQGNKHRLENIGPDKLIIIEVQCGSYLGEDDIVRYDDVYGRITA
jgi:mannose-1-phosphate guanylyltransferase/mannose-6-phosphate isomerase